MSETAGSRHNPAALTSAIREEAGRLGFFRTGAAGVGPLPGREHLHTWLKTGMHGEMHYMSRQAGKRGDPALVLENARSIVVVAMNYYSGRGLTDEPLKARISRYAWGNDYHRLVKLRLGQLRSFIEQQAPGVGCLDYVDTGPVMEKVWGAQTALGWMGKHSNLITREQGSWFFIGVILLTVDLVYDAREPDFCGTCSRCIPACPTGAIVAPYVVDARRCISYLTIELRGPIPRPLRHLIGNRVFGCDDCQEVCPWNRFAVETGEPDFQLREGAWMPELIPLAAISRDEFDAKFRASPVRRAGRDGFVRNVVVALGNSKAEVAVPALKSALKDKSALVRGHAVWALDQIGNSAARGLLAQASLGETDPFVLEEIEAARE